MRFNTERDQKDKTFSPPPPFFTSGFFVLISPPPLLLFTTKIHLKGFTPQKKMHNAQKAGIKGWGKSFIQRNDVLSFFWKEGKVIYPWVENTFMIEHPLIFALFSSVWVSDVLLEGRKGLYLYFPLFFCSNDPYEFHHHRLSKSHPSPHNLKGSEGDPEWYPSEKVQENLG